MTLISQNSSLLFANRSEEMAIKILIEEYERLADCQKILIGAVLMRKREIIDAVIDHLIKPEINDTQLTKKFHSELKLLNRNRLRQLFSILQPPHLFQVGEIKSYYQNLFRFPIIFALKICDTLTRETTGDHQATKVEIVRQLAERIEDLYTIHSHLDNALLNRNDFLNKVMRLADQVNNGTAKDVLKIELEEFLEAPLALYE